MWRRTLALALVGASCSFQHGQVADRDAAGPGDADPTADAATDDAASVQPVDAFVAATNLAATSAGATLISFTSEYCPPNNAPLICEAGYWNRTNFNDGAHATGDNQTAYRAAWASRLKTNNDPEELELAFADNRAAKLDRFVIQNWGRGNGGTLYYSTHVRIYGRAPDATAWTMLVDSALATNETPQTFSLAAPVVVDRVRLSITDGLRSDYWELGEFEAWGWLQ
jgi:hypothetical protein